jgi:DNA polymerase III epsilon subunit-like protein
VQTEKTEAEEFCQKCAILVNSSANTHSRRSQNTAKRFAQAVTITSIDFETANRSRASICAAGIAVFENGTLTESLHWLVRPPKGHGWFLPEFTENCHGLTRFDVQDAPDFSAIAPELLARLTRADIVIAHKASYLPAHELSGSLLCL